MIFICEKCGKEFENTRKRKNCFDCVPPKRRYESKEKQLEERKKQVVKNVQRRREKVKKLSIEYKGGECQICGYNKCIDALEFHHINPEEKEFGISAKGYTRSWEKVRDELDKCILVCSNCHREIHSKDNS